MRIVVFSDLDGTLLNHDDYSFTAAQPALNLLTRAHIPLILVSSKTAPELWEIRELLENYDPFVCENGSVLLVPPVLYDIADAVLQVDSNESNGYRCYYRGSKREEILEILSDYQSQYKFIGFSEMSVEDIVSVTGLSLTSAMAAKQRSATEPVIWNDTESALQEFSKTLHQHSLRIVRGGRFYHVMGQCDKGDAVRELTSVYRKYYADTVHSIGLGDGANDIDMLKSVSTPIIMPGINGGYIQDASLTNALRSPKSAAAGWNEMVIKTVKLLYEKQQISEGI